MLHDGPHPLFCLFLFPFLQVPLTSSRKKNTDLLYEKRSSAWTEMKISLCGIAPSPLPVSPLGPSSRACSEEWRVRSKERRVRSKEWREERGFITQWHRPCNTNVIQKVQSQSSIGEAKMSELFFLLNTNMFCKIIFESIFCILLCVVRVQVLERVMQCWVYCYLDVLCPLQWYLERGLSGYIVRASGNVFFFRSNCFLWCRRLVVHINTLQW